LARSRETIHKKRIVLGGELHAMKRLLRRSNLHTVCEEAHCPNIGECFSRRTATFMILGDVCTRSCGFCGVKSAQALKPPDPAEPAAIARTIEELKIKHAVITSVTRDDLPDEGASQFAKIIRALKNDEVTVEVLTPDFHAREGCLQTVCEAGPNIFNHNIETVRRLTPLVRSGADYDRSLSVLKWVTGHYPTIIVKSGLMVGLGEKYEEVVETLTDLCNASCKIVTVGQYLTPNKNKLPVCEYISQETFEKYKVIGEEIGINYVFSGRFVRSSYMAEAIGNNH